MYIYASVEQHAHNVELPAGGRVVQRLEAVPVLLVGPAVSIV